MSMLKRKSVTLKALAIVMSMAIVTCGIPSLYASAVDEEEIPNAMKRISFEEGEQSAQLNLLGNQAIVVTDKANTEGSKALKVNFVEGNNNGIAFTPVDGIPWDIGDTACLSFSAYNVMKVDKELLIKFDLLDSDTNVPTTCVVKANLVSGEQGIYSTALDIESGGDLAIRHMPSMESGVKGVTHVSGSRKIAGYKLTKITFSVPNNTLSTKILFDNIQILNDGTTTSLNLYNAVDKYGQNTHKEWVTKVRSDQDIIDSDASEQIELNAMLAELASTDERTQYGGWKNEAYKQTATGRFYTKKIGNEWTFIDPEGYPYFATGLDILRVEDMNTWVVGREPMFENLPEKDSSLGDHEEWLADCAVSPLGIPGGKGYNFYTANLERKYGDDYLQDWKQNSLKRFKAWGFTTIGCWADPELFFGQGATSKLPYVANGWVRGDHSKLPFGFNIWQYNHDPFDPEFRVSVETMAAEVKATGANEDPWCIGIYVDNEMDIGMNTDAIAKCIMAYTDTTTEPVYAKLAVIEFLKGKYNNSVAQLNAAWGSNISSWDELKAPYGGVMGDIAEISGLWADKYYSTIKEVLDEELPDLMYFGSRLANFGCSESIIESCARHVDVVSFNSYALEGPQSWMYLGTFDKPVMIGEFSFTAKDRGQFGVGGVPVSEGRFRGFWYEKYMNSTLDNNKFVGAQWFQYYDEPIFGRAWDGENSNTGFVDVTDQPYNDLVENASYINKTMYERKFMGTVVAAPPLPTPDPVVLPPTIPALPLEDPEDPLEEGVVVSLDKSSAQIDANVSSTLQLTATVLPTSTVNKNVIWSSGNTSVATVDNNGIVTAIANGTATITAKSEVDISAQATCVITVINMTNNSIAVTLNQNTATIDATNSNSVQLTATVTPDSTVNKNVLWLSSNNSVATVSNNGLVTAVANGTVTITATSEADSSASASCAVTVTGFTSPPVNMTKISFEINENLGFMSTYNQATTQFTTQGVSDGARALSINVGTLDANYGGVQFDDASPMNWGDNAVFKAYLTNPNNQDLQIRFDIADTSNNVRTYYYTLGANTSRSITIDNLGPQAGSYTGVDGWWGAENGINTQQINFFKVYLWEQRPALTANTFIVDNIEISSGVVEEIDVAMNQSTAQIDVSNSSTLQLTAIVTPDTTSNKNIMWSSSNTSVATVDNNGLVTAVANGTATITATSEADSSASASCAVTVTGFTPPPVNMTMISFEVNENLSFMSTYNQATTQFTTQGVSDGTRALSVNVGTLDANYGGVQFDDADPINWGNNTVFKAYLSNPNNQDIQIRFDIADTSNNVRTYYYSLGANASRTITIDNLGPQTGSFTGADGWWGAENGINTQQINFFKVYMWEQRPGITVNTFIIDNILVTN